MTGPATPATGAGTAGHAAADRRGARDLRRRRGRGRRARASRRRSSRPRSSTRRPETWRTDAEGKRLRTYHNTAVLLPDGRVLVGGHAPLSNAQPEATCTRPGGARPRRTTAATRRSRSTRRRTCARAAQPTIASVAAVDGDTLEIEHRRARATSRQRDAHAQPVGHAHRRRRPAQRRAADRLALRQPVGSGGRRTPTSHRPGHTCCS